MEIWREARGKRDFGSKLSKNQDISNDERFKIQVNNNKDQLGIKNIVLIVEMYVKLKEREGLILKEYNILEELCLKVFLI